MNAVFGARRVARGFTLIELLIVVMVLGVLAAIAFPSYNEAVRKSRRGQAKADLLELAQLAERYKTVNNTYANFGNPAGDGKLAADKGSSPRSGTAYYDVKLTRHTATEFILEAQPIAGQAQASDVKCKTLTINQAGVKTATGSDGVKCW